MSKYKGKRFVNKKTETDLKKQRKVYSKNRQNTIQSASKQNQTIKAQKNKKAKNLILDCISIVCIIAIIISSINIVLWIIDNKASTKLLSDIQNQTQITTEQISIGDNTITKLNYDLSKLLSTNKNTVGWICVPETNINYPVVQYTDNDYYLNHSFDDSSNSAGWIFADSKCNTVDLGYNTIIYGHNRKDKSMFGSLKNVLNSKWLSNTNNYYINYSTLTESNIYQIFSTFVCSENDVNSYIRSDFSNDVEFKNYIQSLKQMSSYQFDTDISDTSKIITLYTCYGINNQRLIVCAKLIR